MRKQELSERSRSCQKQQHPQKSQLGKPSIWHNYVTLIHGPGRGEEEDLFTWIYKATPPNNQAYRALPPRAPTL